MIDAGSRITGPVVQREVLDSPALPKRDWRNGLFVLLLAVYLIPIWSFRYFPSSDGPAHVANAHIIREYNNPDHALFRKYLTFNTTPEPNWSGHLIMAGLMYVVPPLIAEKLLVSLCIVLLPVSIRFVLGVIRPGARFLAFLAFPFTYSSMLHNGFYNFCLSLPLFLFAWGWWMRHRDALTFRKVLTLGMLCLAVFFCHLISLVMVCVAMVTMIVTENLWPAGGSKAKPGPARYLAVLGALPCFILAGLFFSRHGMQYGYTQGLGTRILRLGVLYSLTTFKRGELIVSGLLALGLGALGGYVLYRKNRSGKFTRLDSLAVVAVAFTLVYLVAPDRMSSGSGISERLILYPFFALILWMGTHAYGKVWRTAIPCVAAVIGIATCAYYASRYAELNGYLKDFLAGMSLIAPNSTIVTIPFDYHGNRIPLSLQTLPFWQVGGYISAERGAVDLRNYEAIVGHFPLVFRPERSPKLYLAKGSVLAVQPRLELLQYPERTGGSVDYVLLWVLDQPPMSNPVVASIYAQLASGYDLIHVSPRGLARLYKRKAA
jgi:hypothetical protein